MTHFPFPRLKLPPQKSSVCVLFPSVVSVPSFLALRRKIRRYLSYIFLVSFPPPPPLPRHFSLWCQCSCVPSCMPVIFLCRCLPVCSPMSVQCLPLSSSYLCCPRFLCVLRCVQVRRGGRRPGEDNEGHTHRLIARQSLELGKF